MTDVECVRQLHSQSSLRMAYAFEHIVCLLTLLHDPLTSTLLDMKELFVYVVVYEEMVGVTNLKYS